MKTIFENNIMFKSEKHKNFYEACINKAGCHTDPERKALFYTLGLTMQTQSNIDALYDFKRNNVNFDSLRMGWQTGLSVKLCRLAFNLYSGFYGKGFKGEEASDYTPCELFCSELLPFMLEAIKIRYENRMDC